MWPCANQARPLVLAHVVQEALSPHESHFADAPQASARRTKVGHRVEPKWLLKGGVMVMSDVEADWWRSGVLLTCVHRWSAARSTTGSAKRTFIKEKQGWLWSYIRYDGGCSLALRKAMPGTT